MDADVLPFFVSRVGQNLMNTPYLTVNLVISLPKSNVNTTYICGSGQPYL